jgi:hydrogenase expression/formation protein HypC
MSAEDAATPTCGERVCLTCSDQALPARVLRLLPARMALVDIGGVREEISVALVAARLGDVVLVHAGEAIGRLDARPAGEGRP